MYWVLCKGYIQMRKTVSAVMELRPDDFLLNEKVFKGTREKNRYVQVCCPSGSLLKNKFKFLDQWFPLVT